MSRGFAGVCGYLWAMSLCEGVRVGGRLQAHLLSRIAHEQVRSEEEGAQLTALERTTSAAPRSGGREKRPGVMRAPTSSSAPESPPADPAWRHPAPDGDTAPRRGN